MLRRTAFSSHALRQSSLGLFSPCTVARLCRVALPSSGSGHTTMSSLLQQMREERTLTAHKDLQIIQIPDIIMFEMCPSFHSLEGREELLRLKTMLVSNAFVQSLYSG
eukprot:scpid31643/ scgid29485/ 